MAISYPWSDWVGQAGNGWGRPKIAGNTLSRLFTPPVELRREQTQFSGGSPSNPMDVAAWTLARGEYQFMARTSQALSAAWFSMAARMVQTEHRTPMAGYRRNASSRRVIRGKVGTYLAPVQALAEETLYL